MSDHLLGQTANLAVRAAQLELFVRTLVPDISSVKPLTLYTSAADRQCLLSHDRTGLRVLFLEARRIEGGSPSRATLVAGGNSVL